MYECIKTIRNWLENYREHNPIEYDNILHYEIVSQPRAYWPDQVQIVIFYNDGATASFFTVLDDGSTGVVRVNFNYSVQVDISKHKFNEWTEISDKLIEYPRTVAMDENYLDRLIHELSPFKKLGLIDFKYKPYFISSIKFNLPQPEVCKYFKWTGLN